MTTLREAVLKTKKVSASTNGAGGAAEYNRRKNAFIAAMVVHSDPIVRIAACTDVNIPTSQLVIALETEEDPNVLRAILANGNLPENAIFTFLEDPRAIQFAEDKELSNILVNRIQK